jgi:hypothetical protein
MQKSKAGVLHRRLNQETLGKGIDERSRREAPFDVRFTTRNSRFVNNTSTMPVQLTKLVMSASVTVRPIVLNCRPTGKSSKQKPSPTVSILSSSYNLPRIVVTPAKAGVQGNR